MMHHFTNLGGQHLDHFGVVAVDGILKGVTSPPAGNVKIMHRLGWTLFTTITRVPMRFTPVSQMDISTMLNQELD